MKKLKNDYQAFVPFSRNVIVIYYDLEQRELIGDEKFFHHTLLQYCSACLWAKPDFYQSVMQLTKSYCRLSQERINFHINKLNTLSIQDFGVHPKFTLDQETLSQFNREQKIPIIKPYIASIELAKEVSTVKTPEEKLRMLERVMKGI
jgi:hypothetical protein